VNKENLKKTSILFITLSLIYILYQSKYLFEIVPPIIANNKIFLFGDWTAIVSAIKCNNLGLNVYLENPCDPLKRIHVYGSIFLLLPTITKFKYFFFLIFPIVTIILFLVSIIYYFKFENTKSIFLYFLCIFNPSTLLLLERFNFDLVIFLGLLFIVLINKNIINFIVLIILFSMKFWSIIFSSIFIFSKNENLKKNLIYVLFSLILFFILIYVEYENLKLINLKSAQITASKYFIFGINSLGTFVENNSLIITYGILFISILFIYNIEGGQFDIAINKIEEKEFKLLIISALTLVIMYFAFDNVYYREVFIIGCIPYFLKYQNLKYNRIFLNFLIARYIIFILARVFYKEFEIEWLYLIKNVLDLILISNLIILIFYFTKNYYKKIFQLV
jgi:hypothetical protein